MTLLMISELVELSIIILLNFAESVSSFWVLVLSIFVVSRRFSPSKLSVVIIFVVSISSSLKLSVVALSLYHFLQNYQ